jgi:hypothetical protein
MQNRLYSSYMQSFMSHYTLFTKKKLRGLGLAVEIGLTLLTFHSFFDIKQK